MVNARGRASPDPALALPLHLLDTRFAAVPPSLQLHDRRKEFVAVAGAQPTHLSPTPSPSCCTASSTLPAGLSWRTWSPSKSRRCRSQATYRAPALWPLILSRCQLVTVPCKRETRPVATCPNNCCPKVAGAASMPCGCLRPRVAGLETACTWRLAARAAYASWGRRAEEARTLCPGAMLRFAVDPVRPGVLRSSARPQVLFLAAAAARGASPTIPPSRSFPQWARSAAASRSWPCRAFPTWRCWWHASPLRCPWTSGRCRTCTGASSPPDASQVTGSILSKAKPRLRASPGRRWPRGQGAGAAPCAAWRCVGLP